MRLLIGLSGQSGAGKSLVSEHLKRAFDFDRRAFASPLKAMLEQAGVSYENLWGDRKEQPLELFGGKSTREAMQLLGTEWGRKNFGDDFWVNIFKRDYERFPQPRIVVDDLRFDNEAEAIAAMGGIVIEVRRPTLDITGMKYRHSSEAGLKHQNIDYVLWNTATPGDLRDAVDEVMERAFGVVNSQGQLI